MTASDALSMAGELLKDGRLWVRRSTGAFDDEITQTIAAGFLDLQNAGVCVFDANDPLLRQAAKLYL